MVNDGTFKRSVAPAWFVGWLGAMALAISIFACSTNEQPDSLSPMNPGTGGNSSQSVNLSFGEQGDLLVQPGEVRLVTLQVVPAQVLEVRLALVGTLMDASLDTSVIETDERGMAQVVLYAPSQPGTFRLRASIDQGPTAERQVAVSGAGFGSVVVTPVYDGSRPLKSWVISAHSGLSCQELMGFPYPDGSPDNMVKFGNTIELLGIPVGKQTAFSLRSGSLVSGCTTLDMLAVKERRKISIKVDPVPVVGEQANLSILFSFDQWKWGDVASVWSNRFQKAFYNQEKDAVAALLNAMSTRAGTDKDAFDGARTMGNWDDLIRANLTQLGPYFLDSWVAKTLYQLALNDFTISFQIAGQKTPENTAKVTPVQLFNLMLKEGDHIQANPASWSVKNDDSVILTGTMSFYPTALMGKALTAYGLSVYPTLSSFKQVLGKVVGCLEVAEQLAPNQSNAFADCNQKCLESICQLAVEDMWIRAATKDEVDAIGGMVQYNVAGDVVVDENLNIIGIQGTVLGTIVDTSLSPELKPVNLQGTASGTPQVP
jgi:hypothetical protein